MRRGWAGWVVAGLTLPSPALAWESEQQELVFHDRSPLFDGPFIDSGYLPSESSTIAVRFFVTPTGAVETDMEATSDLTWPETLTHAIKGVPGSGVFKLDSGVSMEAELRYNVDLGYLGDYSGSYALWRKAVRFQKEAEFDPLLLPGAARTKVTLTDADVVVDPFEYNLSIIAGASIRFQLDVYPTASATLAGKRITTGTAAMTAENTTTQIPMPIGDAGEVGLVSKYIADLTGKLDIVFVPSADLCWGGCVEVLSLDYPMTVADVTTEQTFAPVSYTHPLPAFELPFEEHDFGEVEVWNLANLEVPFESLGQLDLEGTAAIEGSEAFSVFPEYFRSAEDYSDGVMVTFAPESVGEQEATLVLETNDPAHTRVEIPLTGVGIEDSIDLPADTDGDTDGGERVSEQVSTCGCQSASGSAAAVAPILLAGLGLARRRRVKA